MKRGTAAERRAAWWYRLRGWRIVGRNVWAGGYELDLVVRRGRSLRFVEVRERAPTRHGEALETVGFEKQRRIRRAAESWLAANADAQRLVCAFDVVAMRNGRLERVERAF